MILIIGGTGTLGTHLSRRLLEHGEQVRVMTRAPVRAASLAEAGADIVKGDLLDRHTVVQAMRGVRAVVSSSHSILGAGKNRSARVDGDGQRTLIAAAEAAGIDHFLFVSAVGASPSHPIDFARIKAGVERVLHASRLPYTIVRPTAFMQVHTHDLIGRQVVLGKPVMVFGKGAMPRNYVAEQDVAAFIVRALQDPSLRGQTIEMGGPDNYTTDQVIAVYERVSGRKARVTRLPVALPRILSPIVRPFHDGVGRVLGSMAHLDTDDQSFDAAPFLARFPMRLTPLEEWARAHVARQRPAGPPHR